MIKVKQLKYIFFFWKANNLNIYWNLFRFIYMLIKTVIFFSDYHLQTNKITRLHMWDQKYCNSEVCLISPNTNCFGFFGFNDVAIDDYWVPSFDLILFCVNWHWFVLELYNTYNLFFLNWGSYILINRYVRYCTLLCTT